MRELLKKLIGEKKEYRQMMARVKALPEDYRFLFDKMQGYMWSYAVGDGYDILHVQYELIELFETGAADQKPALAMTGEDVAAFCDALLENARTYTENCRQKLNREVREKLMAPPQ